MSQEFTLNKKEFNKKLLRLALPISIQGVITATLNMVDTFMVGLLGETELAAVGVGSQLFMIHFMINFGIIGGTATFVAQFYGTGDKPNIRKGIGLAGTMIFMVGLIFFFGTMLFGKEILGFYSKDPAVVELAVKYIRTCAAAFLMIAISNPLSMGFKATQQSKIPMMVSALVFFSNIFFNYVFIFGKFGAPRLGVVGAALGTIIARSVEIIAMVGFAFSKKNYFRGPARSYFGWSREFVGRVIKNAAPTTTNEFLWGLGQTMYVAAFNRIGTSSFAAFEAAQAIANIFSFAAFSVGDAALIFTGQKLGEGKKEEAWAISKHLIKICILAGAACGLLIASTAKPVSGIFKLSPEGKGYMFLILMVIACMEPLGLYNGMQITGFLRGGGDTRFAMFAESGCVWLVAVPMAFAAALIWHVPIHIAVLLTRMEEVVKFFIVTKRYLSKKWMNNVITGL